MVLSSFVIAFSDISSPSIFPFSFSGKLFFFSEKRKPYYSRLFPDWVVRLQKVTENRFQFSICEKSIFPPKITFSKNTENSTCYITSSGSSNDSRHEVITATIYFFFYEGQDFVMKQRIRCCLWKRANRSHF